MNLDFEYWVMGQKIFFKIYLSDFYKKNIRKVVQ